MLFRSSIYLFRTWIRALNRSRSCGALPNILLLVALVYLAAPQQLQAAGNLIQLGSEGLQSLGFKPLEGKRVGLLTNPSGVNQSGTSTIQLFHQDPRVNLVALYGPEHGVYGDEKAGIKVGDKKDPQTGLPVFSLYGAHRKPSPEIDRKSVV